MSECWIVFFLGQFSLVALYGYFKLMAYLDHNPLLDE